MEASDRLDKAGLRASAKVLEGNPRIAVAQYAKEWGADFVLVGSHGVSGLMRFLLGSVAEAALHRSPCSVEIIRRPARDSATASTPMKILIATDGSDCAMAAVRSVAERPWPVSSQMRVVSAVPLSIFAGEMMSPAIAPAYPPLDTVETIQKEARRQAEEAVARAHLGT